MPSKSVLVFSVVVVLFFQNRTSAKCLERDYEIQQYMTSSNASWDNYFNISKAVYPAVNSPALVIKVWIVFVDSSGLPVSRAAYTWSKSCLYVSTKFTSLSRMEIFSLGAIWPSRRQTELQIKLPQLCAGVDEEATMTYFLSTLQDIAVKPTSLDPNLNTVECVIEGHGHAKFFGIKKTLHCVCWIVLIISVVVSTIASQVLTQKLGEYCPEDESLKSDHSKAAAILFLLLCIFILGTVIIIVLLFMNFDWYTVAVFIIFVFVLARRSFWWDKHRPTKLDCNFVGGHYHAISETSGNVFSGVVVYPAVFIACHHLLWIVLGIMTEPFWALTILVSTIAFFFVVFHLVGSYYETMFVSPIDERSEGHSFQAIIMSIISLMVFVLFNFLLMLVGKDLLSHSILANVVQSTLVILITVWYKYMKYSNAVGDNHANDISEEKLNAGDYCHGTKENPGFRGDSEDGGRPNWEERLRVIPYC